MVTVAPPGRFWRGANSQPEGTSIAGEEPFVDGRRRGKSRLLTVEGDGPNGRPPLRAGIDPFGDGAGLPRRPREPSGAFWDATPGAK